MAPLKPEQNGGTQGKESKPNIQLKRRKTKKLGKQIRYSLTQKKSREANQIFTYKKSLGKQTKYSLTK